MEPNPFWHTQKVDQAFAQLGSAETGLSAKEADARLAKYGPNEI